MQKNEVFSRVFRSATDMFAPTLNRGGEADQPRRVLAGRATWRWGFQCFENQRELLLWMRIKAPKQFAKLLCGRE